MPANSINSVPIITSEVKTFGHKWVDHRLTTASIIIDLAIKQHLLDKAPCAIPLTASEEEVKRIQNLTIDILPKLLENARKGNKHGGIGIISSAGAGKKTLAKAITEYFHGTVYVPKQSYPYIINYNSAMKEVESYDKAAIKAWFLSRFKGAINNRVLSTSERASSFDISVGLDWLQALVTFAAYLGIRDSTGNPNDVPPLKPGFKGIPKMWTLLPLLSFPVDMVIFPFTPLNIKIARIKEKYGLDSLEYTRRMIALEYNQVNEELTIDALLKMQLYARKYLGKEIPLYFYPTVRCSPREYPNGFLPINQQNQLDPTVQDVIFLLQGRYPNQLIHRLTSAELERNHKMALVTGEWGDEAAFGGVPGY